MSNSRIGSATNTNTSTYSEARARYMLQKLKEDFINAAYRGFTTVTSADLMDWWGVIEFAIHQKAFIKCQLQFRWPGREAAIVYELVSDGTISIDRDSAADNFHSIPATAAVTVVLDYTRTNQAVAGHLEKKGWTYTGSFVQGDASNSGGYSKDGYGVNIKTIGI